MFFFFYIPQFSLGALLYPPVHATCHSLCHLKAASVMCLHVPYSAHRLDLGVIGTPLVPVFIGSTLKQVLISLVARVLVSNPPTKGKSIAYGNS